MSDDQRVTGIGGVFFKAQDPGTLAAWHRAHLGVPASEGETHALFATDPEGNRFELWQPPPGGI